MHAAARRTGFRWLSAVIFGGGIAASQAAIAAPPAPAPPACQVVPKERINDLYQADPAGQFFKILNWKEVSAPLNKPNALDQYNFTDCIVGGSTEQSLGPFIPMPDPTIMQIGEWFFITGTGDTESTANFAIYRSKDLANFELHMQAFDTDDRNGSGQHQVGDELFLNKGKSYKAMWAPQLYRDPQPGESDPMVYLVFTAIEFENNNEPDWPPFYLNSLHSCFHVRMKQSKFLQWLYICDPLEADGPRFADKRDGYGWQAWFGYQDEDDCNMAPDAEWLYDGGWHEEKYVSCTTTLAQLGDNPGCVHNLEHKWLFDPCPTGTCPAGVLKAWSFQHRDHGSRTAMTIDPFVFIDPSPTDPQWKRVLLHCWDGRGGYLDGGECQGDLCCPEELWGNHIVAAPIRATQFEMEIADNIPMAHAINWWNPIEVDEQQCGVKDPWVPNGVINGEGCPWCFGGVAEGSTVLYLPANDRYYHIYSRNTAFSPAYQLVYRMTDSGGSFQDLQMSSFTDTMVQEHILLQSDSLIAPAGFSFGHAEAFMVTDCDNAVFPYIIFHVKHDQADSRTVCFKELTLDPDGSGRFKQLFRTHAEPERNVGFFRMPACVKKTPLTIGGGGDPPIGGKGGKGKGKGST